MNKHILITARDVGAAINIIEIAKFALNNSGYQLHLYIQQPASQYFFKADINHHVAPHYIAKTKNDRDAELLLEHAENIIKKVKPDAILCGLSTPGDGGIDEAIIAVAKNKIPTYVMQDFWGEVNDFFGYCADYYLCLDQEAKLLTEKKYPCKGVIIGSPRHSWYKNIDTDRLRLELRKAMNLTSSQKVVGLFGQSLHHIPGYQQTISELLQTLAETQPETIVLYRKHPRESEEQAQQTIRLLQDPDIKFFMARHDKVEHSLLACNAVISILSNCLYDSCYLNFFSPFPCITPIALCYKPDIRQHLNNFNMIDASPYKAKKIALICDNERPDNKQMDYLLSDEVSKDLWLASKHLENPQYAAEIALNSITEQLLVV